jgi:hypothetical protein
MQGWKYLLDAVQMGNLRKIGGKGMPEQQYTMAETATEKNLQPGK